MISFEIEKTEAQGAQLIIGRIGSNYLAVI